MHILSFFRKTWWLRMSKTSNKEKIRSPGGFLEEIKAICVKKCIKFGPKLTKYLKIQIFESFIQFLCTFRKTWCLRMLKMSKKEQVSCRGGFFGEIKAIGVEKMHQIQTESDKNTRKQIFKIFMQFLCTFRKTWWLRMLKSKLKSRIESFSYRVYGGKSWNF